MNTTRRYPRTLTEAFDQRDELLAVLKEIHKRLIKCSKDPISAAEAYDSFYQEMACEAINKAERKA